MIFRIRQLLAAAVAAGLLVACGGGGGAGEVTPAPVGDACAQFLAGGLQKVGYGSASTDLAAAGQPRSQQGASKGAVRLGAGGLSAGSSINVLWVGNSLTDTALDFNNYSLGPMPERLKPMLAELGITMTYSSRIQGGAEFSDHARNAATMAEIGKTSYDIVNLQGYYDGFASASAYQTAVKPLYDKARTAGSAVLFEQVWSFKNDPGSPQFPTAAVAVETAAQNMAGAYAVQVMRAWEAVRQKDAALFGRLYADSTHQSMIGEHLNALTYARFFSGRSIQGVTSIAPQVAQALSAAQRQTLKDAVDASVTVFFQGSAAGGGSTTTLSISTPTENQVFPEGSTVTLTARADNSAAGDISASIVWRDASSAELGRGPSISGKFLPGAYTVTASVQPPDNSTAVSTSRQFTVNDAVNDAPVTTDKPVSLPRYEAFRQVNLTSSASDVDGAINWATLQLDKTQFKGTAAAVSSADASTVNLNYGNGFLGADVVRWRVQDNSGAWSNWASINVTVTPIEPQPLRQLALNRNDGTTLEQIDAAWAGASSGYAVQGGLLRALDASSQAAAWIETAESDDQAVEATRVLGGDNGGDFRLYLNTKASQGGYQFRVRSDAVMVSKNGSPFACSLLQANAAAALTVRATTFAGRVRVYLNGSTVALLDQSDAAALKGGYAGLVIFDDGVSSRVALSRFAF
jgi:hypothetical protein